MKFFYDIQNTLFWCTECNNRFIILFFCHTQEWYGLLSSSFAAILLLSSSTLIAIVLIIQSELEIETSSIYASMTKLERDSGGGGSGKKPMKKMSIKTNTTTASPSSDNNSECMTDHVHMATGDVHQQKQQQRTTTKFTNLSSTNRGVKSAIGLSWLLPSLCALCIPMIHKIMGHRSNEWWLEIASSDFIIFAITETLLVSLFMLLFVTLLKHLIYLAKKYEKANSTLKKRWVWLDLCSLYTIWYFTTIALLLPDILLSRSLQFVKLNLFSFFNFFLFTE